MTHFGSGSGRKSSPMNVGSSSTTKRSCRKRQSTCLAEDSAKRNFKGSILAEMGDVRPHDVIDRDTEPDEIFEDHILLGKRIKKTLYYAGRLPPNPRPSFPLTIFAVNAFTNGTLGLNNETLEFLDLDMASEIGRNACVSPTIVILALVYLDRLSKENPSYLKSVKPSELFVVALLVASKFVQDEGEHNSIYNVDWVSPTGFNKERLNELEFKFLSALDWNLNVGWKEFLQNLTKVEQQLSWQEGGCRGWLTYAELNSLSSAILPWNTFWPILYNYLVQVVLIGSIVYVTLLVTVMTSMALTPRLITITGDFLKMTTELPESLQNLQNRIQTIQMPYTAQTNSSFSSTCHVSLSSLVFQHEFLVKGEEVEENSTKQKYGSQLITFALPRLPLLSLVTPEKGTLVDRHS